MIHYVTDDLFNSQADALVNTVNTVGVMGKGIALQFKQQFPNNYLAYKKACDNNEMSIGKMFVFRETSLLGGEKIIINFPTKKHWRQPSQYEYIEEGLKDLIRIISEQKIKSIAIPPLGSGNGGLDWVKVKELLEVYLGNISCDVYVYEPTRHIKKILQKQNVNNKTIELSPARAMMLTLFYDALTYGEVPSEFMGEKIVYFLKRFDSSNAFEKSHFKKHHYGPYSGTVRHVLYYLNGTYLNGFEGKDSKPFEELNIFIDKSKEVEEYLGQEKNANYKIITEQVKTFLSGYYSNFALELISSIDYLLTNEQLSTEDEIKQALAEWNPRKANMFSEDKFIKIGIKKAQEIRI